MSKASSSEAKAADTRTRLLDTALRLVRERGFAATSVNDLCAAAGVTKGAFYHHFASKEQLGVEAARHWADGTSALFAQAAYHAAEDPLDRILGYVALRRRMLEGEIAEFTCLAGTMVQEAYAQHPPIRDACGATIGGHAQTLVADIEAAIAARGMAPAWSAQSLALHTQAVLQGAFVLAKALDSAAVARDSVDHLERYIRCLFAADAAPPAASADAPATSEDER